MKVVTSLYVIPLYKGADSVYKSIVLQLEVINMSHGHMCNGCFVASHPVFLILLLSVDQITVCSSGFSSFLH